jgi:hypothetical protein
VHGLAPNTPLPAVVDAFALAALKRIEEADANLELTPAQASESWGGGRGGSTRPRPSPGNRGFFCNRRRRERPGRLRLVLAAPSLPLVP